VSAAIFMADALSHDVVFFIGEDGLVQMDAPDLIWEDEEVMKLIRSQKPAIKKQLQDGFNCVRDGLSIAEVKALTAAAQQGCIFGEVACMSNMTDITDEAIDALGLDRTDEAIDALGLDRTDEAIDALLLEPDFEADVERLLK